jgi:hypothetical protein
MDFIGDEAISIYTQEIASKGSRSAPPLKPGRAGRIGGGGVKQSVKFNEYFVIHTADHPLLHLPHFRKTENGGEKPRLLSKFLSGFKIRSARRTI